MRQIHRSMQEIDSDVVWCGAMRRGVAGGWREGRPGLFGGSGGVCKDVDVEVDVGRRLSSSPCLKLEVWNYMDR